VSEVEFEDGGQGSEEWSGPSQEEWQGLVGFQQQVTPFLSELAQALQDPGQGYNDAQGYQPQEQQPQQPEFDPWDPNSVQGFIQQGIQEGIQQALGPYSGILGIVASREGEQMAHDELDKIRAEVGDFDKDTAFLVASGLIDQGHDPAAALRQGAQFSKEMEARIRADERQKYTGEIKQIATGSGDLPAGQGAAEQVSGPPGQGGAEKYELVIRNALANGHPTMPVG